MADASVRSENTAPKALDVPTTDVKDLLKPNTEGYYEDEDFRPEPLYQYGTLDTSDTAGAAHQSVAEVSPVFEEARLNNLVTAAKALDPADATPAELVTLPTGSVTVTGSVRTAEEARDEIVAGIKGAAEEPIVYGGMSPQQREAAKADDTADERKAAKENAFEGGPPSNTATTTESTAQRTRTAPGGRTTTQKN